MRRLLTRRNVLNTNDGREQAEAQQVKDLIGNSGNPSVARGAVIALFHPAPVSLGVQ